MTDLLRNRRLVLLACYIVAGVLASAYGASQFLTASAQAVASMRVTPTEIAGADR